MRINWQLLMLAFLAVGIGAGLALQRQANGELRDEIGLLREQNREVGRLQAEKARLTAARVSGEELENLRADHAAVLRLRAEIESLRADVKAREQGGHP
jgi:Tfp pilus assembly protein PilN